MSAERKRGPSAKSGDGGQVRIVLAAERLFGAHGLNGVSMRQINEAAGMLNNSAVAYHFGSKDLLVQRIYEHRLPALDAVRGKMLAEAKLNDRLGDVRELLAILVLPLLTAVDEDGVHSYAAFLRQMMHSHATVTMRNARMDLSPLSAMAMDLLYQAASPLPRPIVTHQLKIASELFMSLLIERDLERDEGSGPILDQDVFVENVLDLMAHIVAHRPSARVLSAYEKVGDD